MPEIFKRRDWEGAALQVLCGSLTPECQTFHEVLKQCHLFEYLVEKNGDNRSAFKPYQTPFLQDKVIPSLNVGYQLIRFLM